MSRFQKTFLRLLVLCSLLLLGLVQVAAQETGDVNNDGNVNIVDALLIAQYSVGLNPSPFYTEVADVDCSGTIDIIDALIVARLYVGLADSFPECDPLAATVAHPRGIQCEEPYFDTIDDARTALESAGIEVLVMQQTSVPVIALCGTLDGITYLASIRIEDLPAALALDWTEN